MTIQKSDSLTRTMVSGDTPVRHCTRPPQHRSVVDDGLILSSMFSSPSLHNHPNNLPQPPVSTFCQLSRIKSAKTHHHSNQYYYHQHKNNLSTSSFTSQRLLPHSLANILRFGTSAFQVNGKQEDPVPRIPPEGINNSSTSTCSELEQNFRRKRRRRRKRLHPKTSPQCFLQSSLSSPPSTSTAESAAQSHSSAYHSGDMPHRQACGDTAATSAVSSRRRWQTKVMLITVALCLAAAVSSSSCQRLPKPPKPPNQQQHFHSRFSSANFYSPTGTASTALTLSSSSSFSSFSPSSSSSMLLSSRSMVAMKPPYEQQQTAIPTQHQHQKSSSRISIPQDHRSVASAASQQHHQHHKSQQKQQLNFPQFSRLSSVEPAAAESLNEIDEEEERERERERMAAEDPLESSVTPTSSPALNITAQVGHPVYLHCIVESLGDKMVSWIRLRDFHLLTIGSLTYIQDDRFAVRPASHHAAGGASNDWSLQIKHVTVRDEGLYECQINSDPPRSQYYYLRIVVPVSEIVGNPDIFVRSGAPINVTCLISSSPAPPAFVFWYHNNRMINYDYGSSGSGSEGGGGTGGGGRGQISVAKDPTRADVVISRLLIRSAVLDDSGNYTCSPSNAEPASTYVHVLQGEKRLSNDIQNDVWSQSEQLAANNEGHHSAAGAGAASSLLMLSNRYNYHFRFAQQTDSVVYYLLSSLFTTTSSITLSISISLTTATTAFAFLLLSVLNSTYYSQLYFK